MVNLRPLFMSFCAIAFIFLSPAELGAQGIYFDFGSRIRSRYMQNVGNSPGSDGETINAHIDKEFCAQSIGTAIYFAIDNEILYQRLARTSDIINVEYYDASAREIKLIYDSIDDPNKVSDIVIKTTGSNRWKSAIFNLEDSFFGDRQRYNADFRLECSDTMTINAVRVAPIDYYIDFGETNDEFLMTQKMRQAGDSMTEIVVIDGEECIATTDESQYIYCDVDDDEIFEGDFPEYFVSVEYYDLDSQLPMRLQYDSEDEPYKDTSWTQGKGWGSFKTYTWEVTDSYTANRQNDGSDFRINFQLPGLPMNRIMLGFLDYGPSAVKSSRMTVRDFKLKNYPNPFNPTTTILFHLPRHSAVSLKIYNIRGELVRTLVDDEFQSGTCAQFWNGLDDSGKRIASGVYVYQLVADDFVTTNKMIKLQ